ncbi:hypothetical protein FQA39_LY03594 [Lamprigera yunnana]|nr:hypothetical protein FQA39_LY03594 [Lamprigera yunnana]
MSCFIVIREYKHSDFHNVFDVIRNAYLSNVFPTWCNALIREITFQIIVMSAALLFIFLGVPLQYCIIAIPVVIISLYLIIYSSYLFKSAELMHSKKPMQCWVAEACEPFIFTERPESTSYRIFSDARACNEMFDMGNFKRKIIGTIAVSNHHSLYNSLWLHRLAVHNSYRKKRVGYALIQTVQNWCCKQNYEILELAMSECQDAARKLFVDTGFEIKQLYHQQLVGSAVTLLMYQMTCDLRNIRPKI